MLIKISYTQVGIIPAISLKMSFRQINVPLNPSECSAIRSQRAKQLAPSSESQPMCTSSNCAILSEREARGSPYLSLQSGPGDDVSVVTPNMSETPECSRALLLSESLNHIYDGHVDKKRLQAVRGQAEAQVEDDVASPVCAGGQNQQSSFENSHRRSGEKDRVSPSSEEMLSRYNSFCLEKQSLIAFSSLEESNDSSSSSRLSLSGESNRLSAALHSVGQRSTEREPKRKALHCLGVTFTQSKSLELLTDDMDMPPSSSVRHLHSESGGSPSSTFICEPSSNLTKLPEVAGAEAEPSPHVVDEYSPELGKTFICSVSALPESDGIHTSTPVQNSGTSMSSCLYLSTCNESGSSPAPQPLKKPGCVNNKQTHLPSKEKVKETKTQMFPKTGHGSVKTKVLTVKANEIVASSQQKSFWDGNKTGVRATPAKVVSRNKVIAASSKALEAQRPLNKKATNLVGTQKASCGISFIKMQNKAPASSTSQHISEECSETSSYPMQTSCSQTDASTQQADSCGSTAETSCKWGQMGSKAALKSEVSSKTQVKSHTKLSQDRPLFSKTRSRCLSENLSTFRPPNERSTALRATTSFTVSKPDTVKSRGKEENPNCPSKNKLDRNQPANREVKKIILVLSKEATDGSATAESKSRCQSRSSPRRAKMSISNFPAPSPRQSPLSGRHKQGILGNSLGKFQENKSSAGCQKGEAPNKVPSRDCKPQGPGPRPNQTSSQSSSMGPSLTPAVKPARKPQRASRSLSDCGVINGTPSRSTLVSGGAAQKATPFKSVLLKARLIPTAARNTGAACTPAASTGRGASNQRFSPVKRLHDGRPTGPTSAGYVDNNKSKASSSHRAPHQRCSHEQSAAPPAPGQDQQLSTVSDHRFQAVAIVLQQTLSERDEATRRCRELSQELVQLKDELASSADSSERLEREREELRVALQDATERMQEQHQKKLEELEEKLQSFYQMEWSKVELAYREEADKSQTLLKKQMEELRENHEAKRLELESRHAEQMESLRQQHRLSVEELRKSHAQELQHSQDSLKEAEAALSEQIQELTVENNALIEKVTAVENKRKERAENTQKDSHTLYLEQELESLRVVLEIKNKKLHQQEKMMIEIAKLTEQNLKLDESLRMVQQENEDLKARMKKHAALSRQLSTEQAILQESLQKESKVNKRLSMENEELLWKLHNGDPNCPRKMSPNSTSPSSSFKLQSPRSSGFFSSAPVSPR